MGARYSPDLLPLNPTSPDVHPRPSRSQVLYPRRVFLSDNVILCVYLSESLSTCAPTWGVGSPDTEGRGGRVGWVVGV